MSSWKTDTSGMSEGPVRGSCHAEEIHPTTAPVASSRVVSLHSEDGVPRRVDRGRGRRADKDPSRRADPRGARVPGLRTPCSTARPGDRDVDPRSGRPAPGSQLRAAGLDALRAAFVGGHQTSRRDDPSGRVAKCRRSSRGVVDPVSGAPDAVFRVSRNPSRGESVDQDRHRRRGPRASVSDGRRARSSVYGRETFRDHRHEVGASVARGGGRYSDPVGSRRTPHGSQTTSGQGSQVGRSAR